jgi:hypothetical protein
MRVDVEAMVKVIAEIRNTKQLYWGPKVQAIVDSHVLTQAEEDKLKDVPDKVVTLWCRFLWNFRDLPDAVVHGTGFEVDWISPPATFAHALAQLANVVPFIRHPR